uniref:Uncharacterized protein n=1 Tax=Siphoviridae sp. ctedO8 TaxID=2827907 RepID=A0A8S5T2Z7_9CAUD|nr:MAG TPA: hypothetical protein [Siphoviridae sp. ctedO8]
MTCILEPGLIVTLLEINSIISYLASAGLPEAAGDCP